MHTPTTLDRNDTRQRVLLYHIEPSLCSQKVRLALAEKGVSYETQLVDIGPKHENYEAWYMRINPRGVVPTLVHGETIITDSVRILRYIDETFEGPLLGAELQDEETQQLEYWIRLQDEFPMREISYTKMPALIRPILLRDMSVRKKLLREGAQKHPDLSDRYLSRLEDVEQWHALITSPQKVEDLHIKLEEILDRFERHIEGRSFVVGQSYTRADVVWTVVLARLGLMDVPSGWKEGKWPLARAYYESMKQRPSFEQAGLVDSSPLKLILPRIAKHFLPKIALATICIAAVVGVWRMWG